MNIHKSLDIKLQNLLIPESENSVLMADFVMCEMDLDRESGTAIILKDLFDRGKVSREQIILDFGKAVWEIISGLQKIEKIDTRKSSANVENFIKLLLTLSDDFRVFLIRLGQRYFEMRHLSDFDKDIQKQLTDETVLLYIPLAHRIGLYHIKTEVEDIVLRFTDPESYSVIEGKLRETSRERALYTSRFTLPIEIRLKEAGFDCEIKTRVKSISSINRKMLVQKVGFEKVYDLFAIRIIIQTTRDNEKSDCWSVYSHVTDIYTPNPRRLRDWITIGKSTGYESLHTTVIGPDGRWVEVQIRTQRMDEIAEKGLAAHWKYKSGKEADSRNNLYAGIREMLEKQGKSKADKNLSRDKRALYSDEIFIFTPQGDLLKMKAGYTVLDFAFEIHTEVGYGCTGAMVNGKMVPLKHILQNGDMVKILTSKNQKPHQGWLEIVKSPRTLARIKHALKMEQYREAETGKEIIKNKVVQLDLEFTDAVINKLCSFFNCGSYLELYQKFGEGKLETSKIRKALLEPEPDVKKTVPIPEEPFNERIVHEGSQDYVVIDPRIGSIQYQLAKCCNPVSGVPIFAFVSVSQGIRIHRTICKNAHQLITRYPYRILEARWKKIEKTL